MHAQDCIRFVWNKESEARVGAQQPWRSGSSSSAILRTELELPLPQRCWARLLLFSMKASLFVEQRRLFLFFPDEKSPLDLAFVIELHAFEFQSFALFARVMRAAFGNWQFAIFVNDAPPRNAIHNLAHHAATNVTRNWWVATRAQRAVRCDAAKGNRSAKQFNLFAQSSGFIT